MANFGDGSVSVIDRSTTEVTATVQVGVSPFGIAVNPSGTVAYVANNGDATITVIDLPANTVNPLTPTVGVGAGVAMHPSLPVTVGAGPAGVAVNAAGTRVYVALQGESQVAVIGPGPSGSACIPRGRASTWRTPAATACP